MTEQLVIQTSNQLINPMTTYILQHESNINTTNTTHWYAQWYNDTTTQWYNDTATMIQRPYPVARLCTADSCLIWACREICESTALWGAYRTGCACVLWRRWRRSPSHWRVRWNRKTTLVRASVPRACAKTLKKPQNSQRDNLREDHHAIHKHSSCIFFCYVAVRDETSDVIFDAEDAPPFLWASPSRIH